jgi:hypothetical protein
VNPFCRGRRRDKAFGIASNLETNWSGSENQAKNVTLEGVSYRAKKNKKPAGGAAYAGEQIRK